MAPSIWQILIVVLVVVVLFGAGRLPRIMEDLAKGLQAFKKGMKDEDDKKQIQKDTHKSDSKTE